MKHGDIEASAITAASVTVSGTITANGGSVTSPVNLLISVDAGLDATLQAGGNATLSGGSSANVISGGQTVLDGFSGGATIVLTDSMDVSVNNTITLTSDNTSIDLVAPAINGESSGNTTWTSTGGNVVLTASSGAVNLSAGTVVEIANGILQVGNGGGSNVTLTSTDDGATVLDVSAGIRTVDGTAGQPAYRFESTPNAGMYIDNSTLGIGHTTGGITISGSGLTQLIGEAGVVIYSLDKFAVDSATLGFFNVTPVAQPSDVADATDAASAITQLNAALAALRALGLIAT